MDGSLLLVALSVTSHCLFWTLTAECMTGSVTHPHACLAGANTYHAPESAPALEILQLKWRFHTGFWDKDIFPQRLQSTAVICLMGEKNCKLFDPLHICSKMLIRSRMEGSGYWEILWNKLLLWSGNWWSFITKFKIIEIIIKGRWGRMRLAIKPAC